MLGRHVYAVGHFCRSARPQAAGRNGGAERHVAPIASPENPAWKAGAPAINVPSRLRHEQPAARSPSLERGGRLAKCLIISDGGVAQLVRAAES